MEKYRQQIAANEGLIALSVIGACTGVIIGLIMAAFHLLINWGQSLFLADPEKFEALHWALRGSLCISGACFLGWAIQRWASSDLPIGVVQVMESLVKRHGQLRFRGVVVQFFAAVVALVTGQSSGREGPSVHLGAGTSSVIGQQLRLPRNSMRILVGCGIAAAISASFNTPLAGVIFAMEVILKEYTIVGFAPVILTAVTATSVARFIERAEPAFVVEALNMGSAWAYPWLLVVGIILGLVAASFTWLVDYFTTVQTKRPMWQRMGLAGCITAVLGIASPEIMGLGYDTVNNALSGQLGLSANGQLAVGALVLLATAKLIATAASVGLGIPAGLIGPLFVIGSVIGVLLGHTGAWFAQDVLGLSSSTHPAFYALIGMGTLMSAVLHAPLAALTAMLELTGNSHIILPGMLTSITAYLVAKSWFKRPAIFNLLLAKRGHDYHFEPGFLSLERIGVRAVCSQNFTCIPRFSSPQDIAISHDNNDHGEHAGWFIAMENDIPRAAIEVDALMDFRNAGSLDETTKVGLLALPIPHLKIATITGPSTLWEAEKRFKEYDGVELLIVVADNAERTMLGVIPKQTVQTIKDKGYINQDH